jgi:hypothetical protein
MNGYLDKLNLKPLEKRMVVLVAAVLFFVLNWWFVFPHFSDWSKVQFRVNKARKTLATFEREIAQTNTFTRAVKQLESEGYSVAPEDQALHFANTRESVAAQSGVIIAQASKPTTRTNQFFLELSQNISLQTREQQLVDFLYNLGASNSLIRVRDLTLRTDGPRMQLSANVKLVASYQKKTQPAKTRTATTAAANPEEGTRTRRSLPFE